MATSKKNTGVIRAVTRSPKETQALARRFGATLRPGDVIRLEGDLGSGKTLFVKGLAQGLGLKNPDAVKSPTFVIMHIYRAKVPIYHFDLYRLEGAQELDAIGMEDFTHDPGAVVCVEWAERGPDFFPNTSKRVQIRIRGENEREIVIRSGRRTRKAKA